MGIAPMVNPEPIRCQNCGKPMTTFAQWRSESCEADEATGHVLDPLQILALQWRTVAQADQIEKEAAR